MKEVWSSDDITSKSLLQFVIYFKTCIHETLELGQENLKLAQRCMKKWYDDKAQQSEFNVANEVLVLLPFQGKPLADKYTVEWRVGLGRWIIWSKLQTGENPTSCAM